MEEITRIIIEGPDCSGKSTVVDRIKNALRWDSKSLHHKEGYQFRRYLLEYAINDRIVFDRSHFSEAVYSRLWRGGSPFSKKERKILDEICTIGTLVIFTCPDIQTIKQRYHHREFEQQIKYHELEKSRELFCEELKSIPYILYQSKNYDELNDLVKKVLDLIK
ncbi:MAG: hypothetical protein ABIB71_01750 [Candidatus Woesearchaeota archaeon]